MSIDGKVCPYCKANTDFVDSKVIYGRSYGMVYLCNPCKAWVGIHKGTDKALGRLANAELRRAKGQAHMYFDQLWKRKMLKHNLNKKTARGRAYKWLSESLGVPFELTHIGMFDVDMCKKVVELCKPYCIKQRGDEGAATMVGHVYEEIKQTGGGDE